jgi:hypothetical protein
MGPGALPGRMGHATTGKLAFPALFCPRRGWRESRVPVRERKPRLIFFSLSEQTIHSELDYRLSIPEGLAAFNVLQTRGVPSRFLTFPDENHWVLKPEVSRHCPPRAAERLASTDQGLPLNQNSLVWHREVVSDAIWPVKVVQPPAVQVWIMDRASTDKAYNAVRLDQQIQRPYRFSGRNGHEGAEHELSGGRVDPQSAIPCSSEAHKSLAHASLPALYGGLDWMRFEQRTKLSGSDYSANIRHTLLPPDILPVHVPIDRPCTT